MTNRVNVPPGWYPDPLNRDAQRYWDGVAWTENSAPYVARPEPVRSPASQVVARPWWRSTWVWAIAVVLVILVIAAVLNDQPKADTATRGLASLSTPPPVATPSSQAAESSVPQLVGLTRAEGRQALLASGLRIGSVRKEPSASSPGTILEQSVEPGTSLAPGGSVTLVVASPLPRVPDVVGLSKSEAVAQLKERGFRVTTSTKTVTRGEDGVVLSQSPKNSATSVQPGATVRLVIADVQAPAPPPSNCTDGYSPCLAPASDYDCAGGSGDGPEYVYGTVQVSGSDPYDLDRDGDGLGCD